jgi:TfoX/Sxy family transcriptional regulator of competence genes
VSELDLAKVTSATLEVKHFFSGAALYANGTLCVSWSPAGLAFRLSNTEVARLIASGTAKPLKYFEKGYIKKGYAAFDNSDTSDATRWKEYFLDAITLATQVHPK